jgi:transcriptional regulator with XRE-family HTH domain
MRFDPDKLIRQRQALGYSQETLAALSNVSVRTIQRAETGETLRRENMADIAAALRVSMQALAPDGGERAAGAGDTISLRPAASAREIIDLIEGSRLAKLECEADPTPDKLPVLRETITLLEARFPDPWQDRPAFPSLVQRLETIAELDRVMTKLAEAGLAIFVGRRFEQAVMPIAFDEGYDTRRNQQPETVAAARLLIAPATADKRTVSAAVDWPVEVFREERADAGAD